MLKGLSTTASALALSVKVLPVLVAPELRLTVSGVNTARTPFGNPRRLRSTDPTYPLGALTVTATGLEAFCLTETLGALSVKFNLHGSKPHVGFDVDVHDASRQGMINPRKTVCFMRSL